jgi:hypothetical protein
MLCRCGSVHRVRCMKPMDRLGGTQRLQATGTCVLHAQAAVLVSSQEVEAAAVGTGPWYGPPEVTTAIATVTGVGGSSCQRSCMAHSTCCEART